MTDWPPGYKGEMIFLKSFIPTALTSQRPALLRVSALFPFTMQFKLAALTTLAVATLAAATPTKRSSPQDQCNTEELQCCQEVQAASDPLAAGLIDFLGATISGVTGLVGITCAPIQVIGIGGNSCTAQPVCCTDNSFNGVIAAGCTPIKGNL